MKEELRHRKRFLLGLDQSYVLEEKFGRLLQEDPHNGMDGYRIRTLYFNSWKRQDLRGEEETRKKQEKLKLRIYDPAANFAFLVLEQEWGELCRKRWMRITRETTEALLRGEYGALYRYGEAFGAECEGLLQTGVPFPGAILESRRRAYFMREDHVRITFDYDLKASFQTRDFWAPHLSQIYAADPCMVILKVSCSGVLPDPLLEMCEEALPFL